METKQCSHCKRTQPVSEFHRNRTRADGYNQWCKGCKSESNRIAGHSRKQWERIKADPQRYAAHIAGQRRTRLVGRYGISEDIYDRILDLQGGRCALCEREMDYRLFVDHDHQTGRVRGLLCARCNGALGWLEVRRDKILAYVDEEPAWLANTTVVSTD